MAVDRVQELLTDNIDLWTGTVEKKSSAGRGSNGKKHLYGIKKLRELILELAVRGKLVPQESSDEPASVLLEQIAVEQDRLAKEKKIKKPKKLPEISEEAKPFELPKGWVWTYLNSIGDWGAGATPKRSTSEFYGGHIPWFKSGELSSDYISKSEETVTELAMKQTSLRYNSPGDVLIAMYGATIGKTSILKVAATTNQAVCACTPFTGISNIYILNLLKAYRNRFTELGAGGAQPNISREKIIATVFPLPPSQEQHRIVAKVDELMALCDQIEQQTEQQLDAHQQLVDTLLDTLTQSQNADELADNWARLSQHFDTLFTTEASIDQLKQTILQLAMMGKLVPQNPNDEPASTLLERIAAEKAQLLKEKKIKKQKPLQPISEEEKPFELPTGWEWSSLSNLVSVVTDGDHQAPPKAESGIPFLVIGNLNKGYISFENCKFVPDTYYEELDWIRQPRSGDILYTVTGSFGIPILVEVDSKFCVQRHVAILKTNNATPTQYVHMFLRSKFALDYSASVATGIAQKTVSLTGLRQMPVALPPAEEQHRIVTKVNELFTLCDQLKQHLQQNQRTQLLLTDTLVQEALSP